MEQINKVYKKEQRSPALHKRKVTQKWLVARNPPFNASIVLLLLPSEDRKFLSLMLLLVSLKVEDFI